MQAKLVGALLFSILAACAIVSLTIMSDETISSTPTEDIQVSGYLTIPQSAIAQQPQVASAAPTIQYAYAAAAPQVYQQPCYAISCAASPLPVADGVARMSAHGAHRKANALKRSLRRLRRKERKDIRAVRRSVRKTVTAEIDRVSKTFDRRLSRVLKQIASLKSKLANVAAKTARPGPPGPPGPRGRRGPPGRK